jgi:hypothetical protein
MVLRHVFEAVVRAWTAATNWPIVSDGLRLLIGGAEMMSRSGGPQQQADAGSLELRGSTVRDAAQRRRQQLRKLYAFEPIRPTVVCYLSGDQHRHKNE